MPINGGAADDLMHRPGICGGRSVFLKHLPGMTLLTVNFCLQAAFKWTKWLRCDEERTYYLWQVVRKIHFISSLLL